MLKGFRVIAALVVCVILVVGGAIWRLTPRGEVSPPSQGDDPGGTAVPSDQQPTVQPIAADASPAAERSSDDTATTTATPAEELIAVCKDKAASFVESLDAEIERADAEHKHIPTNVRNKFTELHESHVQLLQEEKYDRAHEVLGDIYILLLFCPHAPGEGGSGGGLLSKLQDIEGNLAEVVAVYPGTVEIAADSNAAKSIAYGRKEILKVGQQYGAGGVYRLRGELKKKPTEGD